MILKYIKKDEIDKLLGNVQYYFENGNYLKEKSWLEEELVSKVFLDTGIRVNDFELIGPSEKSTDNDFENAKKLFLALKDITPEQATDNRLWIYLTHCVYWDYMKERWPINDLDCKKAMGRIKDRYLMSNSGDKALLRNALSRLWWISYTTYDENLDNPFELTEFLFSNSDFQVGLLERTFSRNTDITRNIIKAVKNFKDDTSIEKSGSLREKLRKLLKRINAIGGVKVLDFMEYDEIERIVYSELQ